jgi:hypothetical protein
MMHEGWKIGKGDKAPAKYNEVKQNTDTTQKINKESKQNTHEGQIERKTAGGTATQIKIRSERKGKK